MVAPRASIVTAFVVSVAAKKKKQAKPLSFKVGVGKVIRGVGSVFTSSLVYLLRLTHHLLSPQWDEALLTMSKGETARLEIEPEWAYGKKGLPDSKYPLLQDSYFEMCRCG